MGVVIGSAVIPIAFSITWAKCSTAGAVGGAVSGLVAAVITWLVVAKVRVHGRLHVCLQITKEMVRLSSSYVLAIVHDPRQYQIASEKSEK
jgi:Na+(H+)/acetate symporter ActP